jgi:hypothetical protein
VAANGPVPGAEDLPIDVSPSALLRGVMDADPLAAMLDENGAESLVMDEPPPSPAPVMDDPRPPTKDLPPIPLVAVEETFVIERANDIAAGTTPKRKSPPEKVAKSGPSKPAPTPVLIDLPADEAPLFTVEPPLVPAAKAAVEAPPVPQAGAAARPREGKGGGHQAGNGADHGSDRDADPDARAGAGRRDLARWPPRPRHAHRLADRPHRRPRVRRPRARGVLAASGAACSP